MIRKITKKILANLGYEIDRQSTGWLAGRTYWDTNYLQRLRFSPKTVVDVGVAYGSPTAENHALYEAFPKAYFVLLEPLKEFVPNINAILQKYKGVHISSAVGSKVAQGKMKIESKWIERSSIFDRTTLEVSGDVLSEREITITTLDTLLDEYQFEGPFGIKIDAEGCEVAVIEGASRMLQDTEFVIVEVAVAPRFKGGYTFAEFVSLMDRKNFELCDLLDIGRADNSEVTFIDGVFKNKNT